MSSLQARQQALVDALFAHPAQPAEAALQPMIKDAQGRGLLAYQSSGHALAQRALHAAYPVVQQMLGEESFSDLARALWHAHPPACGDVARWGEALAEFVAVSAQLQDVPYLADVARAEWALHCCATAPDKDADTSSFAMLGSHDPAALLLVLAPGTAMLPSRWPLAGLLGSHLLGEPSLDVVGALLRDGEAQDVVVWRHAYQPKFRQAKPGECEFLQALGGGANLAAALDNSPALDFTTWLIPAVQSGLLLQVTTTA